jgi:hypothetical protein
MEKRFSVIFGVLIGAMWMGEVLLGNLGGTFIFGDLRDSHPRVYGLAPLFALSAVGLTAVCGLTTAYQTESIVTALRVSLWAGLISGAFSFVTIVGVVTLFHDAMMKDSSNIHEFARSAHRTPSDAELSKFIYLDGLAGGLNHIWIGPLLGITVGGIGGIAGRFLRSSDESVKRSAPHTEATGRTVGGV